MARGLKLRAWSCVRQLMSSGGSISVSVTVSPRRADGEGSSSPLPPGRTSKAGLGKSGRAAAWLALARGASVLAIDRDKKLCPLEHDPAFENHDEIRTILGKIDIEQLHSADTIVVSPGVPLDNYGLRSLLQS
ncbi:hypothetical protein CRG98_007390, partial [Punica granatum]